jgi:hypothetical protein
MSAGALKSIELLIRGLRGAAETVTVFETNWPLTDCTANLYVRPLVRPVNFTDVADALAVFTARQLP